MSLDNRADWIKWCFFGVAVAMVPIVWAAVHAQLELMRVIGHGELLLIGNAFAAEALGDVILASSAGRGTKALMGGGSLLCIIGCSMFYAELALRPSPEHEPKLGLVIWSVALFLLSLVVAARSKWVCAAEGGEP